MGYRLNRLDEPVFIAVSKPLLTEFDIHHRLESCVNYPALFLDPSSDKSCVILYALGGNPGMLSYGVGGVAVGGQVSGHPGVWGS